MKIFTILTLSAAILIFTTNTWANFPCEEAWSVDLDITATVLGPSWQDDDGQTFFLVGTADKVLMITNDEITWESPELPGMVTALNCVDFGVDDGWEIIAATYSDSGRIHVFNGDDFNEHNQYGLYGYYRYTPQMTHQILENDDRYINSIDVFEDLLPDSAKMIIVGNIRRYSEYDEGGNQWWEDDYTYGGFTSISLNRIVPLREGPDRPGSVLDTDMIDSNNDGEINLICGSYLSSSSWGSMQASTDLSQINLTVIDNELNILSDSMLARYHWSDRGDRSKHVYLHSMEVLSVTDSLSYVAVSYKDTSEYLLELLSLPELETVTSLTLRDKPFVDIQTFNTHDEDNEVFLICFDETGKLYTVGMNSFRIVDYIDDFAAGIVGSEVGNFDDDEDLEMVVLTQRRFTMYDLGTLSAPSGSEHLWIPESYSITAAYPNPFNSSTCLEYDIPQAGRVALSVYDITGREIVRLADGWQSAGRYSIVFKGDNLANGLYLISLDAGGRKVVRQVQLLK